MALSNLLDTSTVTFSELLGNGKIYRVPPYQRDYSWREQNREDLWPNIMDLHRESEQRHTWARWCCRASRIASSSSSTASSVLQR